MPLRRPEPPALAGARDPVVLGRRRLGVGVVQEASACDLRLVTGSALLATVPLLPGLSLFGLFNILVGVWRFGRVWTIGWLIAPLPILFPPPFLTGVVWSLIGIIIANG